MFDVKPKVSNKPTDCGAVCMQMLLDYYGVEVTLEEMLRECNVTLSGCNGKDLLLCGRKYGLEMRAWAANTEDVVNIFDRPSIVWWKRNHWVVCCGLNEYGKVVICNPNKGRYSVSRALFEAFYDNCYHVLRPEEGVDFWGGVAISNGEPPSGDEIEPVNGDVIG